MILLTPWAWVGVLGIGLPILVHLLARGHARVHRFPSLRFLEASRLLPTRRTRIHDTALLAIRCGIVLLACAALAHPVVLTSRRARALDRGLARAIIVDTSASMRRMTARGGPAVDSARRAAQALVQTAQASIVIDSNDPVAALTGAAAWLAGQGRRSEVIVISDFQRGALDSLDVEAIPRELGIGLRRIEIADTAAAERRAAVGGSVASVRAAVVGNRTDAEWTVSARADSGDAVVLLGAESDRATIDAVQKAAATAPVALPTDSTRRIAIVFSSYGDRPALEEAARPAHARWMVDLLAKIEARGISVTRSGVADVIGRSRLALFTRAAPSSLEAVRLAALARQATSVAPPTRELDPATIPAASLAAWQRSPSDVPSQQRPLDREGPSDARWLWIAAVVLLLIEQRVRRLRDVPAQVAEERARAA